MLASITRSNIKSSLASRTKSTVNTCSARAETTPFGYRKTVKQNIPEQGANDSSQDGYDK